MTTIQKQKQLQFLGYYKGQIDGAWGNQSKDATKQFQADYGLFEDGVFGKLTETKSIEIVVAIQMAVGAEIDGFVGSETVTKTKAWQKAHGLISDGIAGEKTRAKMFNTETNNAEVKADIDDWWDDIKYFKRSEFRCKCGGKYCNGFPVEPAKDLVKLLDDVRTHYGKPFTPNSAIRCKKHNANVGGASSSQHLYGTAADIPASSLGVTPKELYNHLCSLLPNTGGIGLYSWGCHVDVRANKSRWNG